MTIFSFKKQKAKKLHDDGLKLEESGYTEEAIEKYLAAIDCDPMKSESYYNIGLIYKYQGKWAESLEFNKKANNIAPDDEAARWNLAIAATALRNWKIARKAWRENGIDLAIVEDPIDMDFGVTPVRLNPDDDGEVVWAKRIDPVRAKIESIPFPESGYKYDDVVLHDGAPVGYRQFDNKEYPVFNVLELFESSAYKTCSARVSIQDQSDIELLENLFSQSDCELEDWTESVRVLCRQCSEGKPHEQHDEELKSEWHSERRLGVAFHVYEDAKQLFDRWQKTSGGILLEIKGEDSVRSS